MTVRYHARQERLIPEYVCQRDGIEHAISICQRVLGDQIDKAVGQLLVGSVAPLALEVTLSVQHELQARIEEVDKLRKKQVERARYDADLAQRRYLHVDPANRLVADSLEADWNKKLRLLTEAQEQYEHQRQQDRVAVDGQQRARIAALASDFPRLWQDPKTPDRERKRMVRLLLADVTLIRGTGITVHVRFNGGVTRTLELIVQIGDIVTVNGQPAKGTLTQRSTGLGLTPNAKPGGLFPNSAIADTVRQNMVEICFEVLQADGTPVGSIMAQGVSQGSAPPGPLRRRRETTSL